MILDFFTILLTTTMSIEAIASIITSIVVPFAGWIYLKVIKPSRLKKKARIKQMAEMFDKLSYVHNQFTEKNGFSKKLDGVLAGQIELEKGQKELKENFLVLEQRFDQYDDKQRAYANMEDKVVFMSDTTGGWVEVSPALVKMLNSSETNLKGHNWLTGIKDKHQQYITKKRYDESIRLKNFFDEKVCYNTDNGDIWINITAYHSYNKKTGEYMASYGSIYQCESPSGHESKEILKNDLKNLA